MNVLYKIGFICCFISLPVIARCQYRSHSAALPVIKLTANNSGKRLVISKSRIFILSLPNHVDGGYRFDKPHYNASVLRMIKHIETPPAGNSHLGHPGKDAWQFIALNKGSSPIKITASRHWAGGGTIILFENIIIVK